MKSNELYKMIRSGAGWVTDENFISTATDSPGSDIYQSLLLLASQNMLYDEDRIDYDGTDKPPVKGRMTMDMVKRKWRKELRMGSNMKENKSLKENYERFFGKMTTENHLGQKVKIKEANYFNPDTDLFGVMFNIREARQVLDYYRDSNPNGIRIGGSSNLYHAGTENDLFDFLSELSSVGIDLDSAIELIFYNGQEISLDEYIDKVGPISD